MKYLVNWNERPQGSAIEYENAQKRILKIFLHWEIPTEVKVHAFVVRVGEWGGNMLFEADDPLIMHKVFDLPGVPIRSPSGHRRSGRGPRRDGSYQMAG